MAEIFEGRPFVPGGYGEPDFSTLPRQSVERLLRSWFVWLKDGSRIHLLPSGRNDLEAEFQIRRWKTREHRVMFRWRNSPPTRATFIAVRDEFRTVAPTAEVEMTRRSGNPRALVLSASASDPLAPTWAVGLSLHAFRAGGVTSAESFDLRCRAYALDSPQGPSHIALEPLSRAWSTGVKVGSLIGRIGRPR
jgi:hypothetical protein